MHNSGMSNNPIFTIMGVYVITDFFSSIFIKETFYMLFKTVSSNGSTLTYKVQPSIVQDYKNDNSYVYKLSNVKNLTAEKTGNLVVLHYTSDSLNADLLLDIDSK